MKRISCPSYALDYAYTACASAIVDEKERNRMLVAAGDVRDTGADFIDKAKAGQTFELRPLIVRRGEDPVVIAGIRKSEFIKLYEYYMVQRPAGRGIYDSILVAAEDSCPTCGGIGRPRTLDHYLPKANYPKLSVFPHNLIPACRDCNTDKGNPLFTHPDKQLIHPYLDHACFFDQVWVIAAVTHAQPCVITYEAIPPETWRHVDRQRAVNHFGFFDIAKRYSIRAAEELSILVDQRRCLMRDLPADSFKEHLNSIAESPRLFPNHWRKVMYKALALDERFCRAQL